MRYIFIMLLFVGSLHASSIGIVKSVKGSVVAKSGNSTVTLKNGNMLDSGMVLMTKHNSSATIIFSDNSSLVLGANSLLNLEKFVFKPLEKEYGFELFLKKGTISFESGKIGDLSPEDFILKTPEGTVAIRGTKFIVEVP